MAAVTGITGAVTSWAGTQNTRLISTGAKPASFTLNVPAPANPTTGFSDVGIRTMLKDIYDWSGTISAQLAAPSSGTAGLVTFAAGYTTNLNSWNLTIAGEEFPVTAFGAAARAFIPGGFGWSGGFSGFLDGTTVASIPSVSASEPGSATFKYAEAGATDMTLAGSIVTTLLNIGVSPSAANAVSYSFEGTGALTQSTPSAGEPVLPAGAVAIPVAGELVLTASTGRTFTGDAFWTSIAISCTVGQPVTVEIGFRGTGALTFA